ncbi:hypothetical protein Psch_02314 [Pelotomaculum schinkii]|uniref:Uncharacterized protein n=1 Tax=Pelotomaculum schinkii TaxID=78350 RepID=A0A4Y7R9B1_9FIRM|nr:hypothetical protein [Pelotomaculum schinkii]TEB05273.1 hypothetical protein Psch_02314 [Pelotomaculum schinkii]
MSRQILQNRGFENELASYVTQGKVTINTDIAYSGMKSAQLLSTPLSTAEIAQVVFLILPGAQVRLSFFAKRFVGENATNISNIRAEVNFVNAFGVVIPPGIVMAIRGCDISENAWNYYEGYAEAPFGTLAALAVIRLEPPTSGTSSLLVDDLALVVEVGAPVPPPPPPSASPIYHEIPGIFTDASVNNSDAVGPAFSIQQ